MASQPSASPLGLKQVVPLVVWHQSKHPLPYFGHQKLDPDYFPKHLCDPVGHFKLPDTGVEIAPWDEDESDAAADIDSDADDEFTGASAGKSKSQRKSKALPKLLEASDVKRLKIAGGRPAVAKKVTADLDSDDELIVRMKEARYLEKDIAQALIDQGRTAYNPKTIGTRWRRLKAALQKRQDDLLDADLTDWHEGDDDVLFEAVARADKEVQRLTDEIEARKWRIVADRMKNLKPVVNFSQNACRERFDALKTGTAKPTPESIPNPSPEVLVRIKSRTDKEARLSKDDCLGEAEKANVEANGWTSRMRTYF